MHPDVPTEMVTIFQGDIICETPPEEKTSSISKQHFQSGVADLKPRLIPGSNLAARRRYGAYGNPDRLADTAA